MKRLVLATTDLSPAFALPVGPQTAASYVFKRGYPSPETGAPKVMIEA